MSEKGRVYDYKKSEKGICKELVKNIKSKGDFDSDICPGAFEIYRKLYEATIRSEDKK